MERRLAAILAADVVGYSRLMGADEAGTLERLKTCEAEIIEPSVADHGGRIVKRMGDGYLVEFASVVSAVECAKAWQQGACDPLNFRIGVHLGDVIVRDGDLYGDGVNVASRLEALADPGGVCLSEDAQRQVRGKLEAGFEDLGTKDLKNIADPIRVFRLLLGDARVAALEDTGARSPSGQPTLLFKPFRHLGDPAQSYITEGLTETLSAALALFEEFAFVGASSEDSRGPATFLLEGSVQTSGRRGRIGVQLSEVASGRKVWGKTLDHATDDIFALQDEVVGIIASTMGEAILEESANALRNKPRSAFTPHDWALDGIQHLHRGDPEEMRKARHCLERALTLAPGLPLGSIGLGWTYTLELVNGWSPGRADAYDFCVDLAKDLLKENARYDQAHRLLSRLYHFSGRHDEALEHSRRATEINPYNSDMMVSYGLSLVYVGRAVEGIGLIERGCRINPYAPAYYQVYLALGYFLCGRFEDAVSRLRGLERPVSFSSLVLAGSLAALGLQDEAAAEIRAHRDAHPEATLKVIADSIPLKKERDRKAYLGALAKAGLPVGENAAPETDEQDAPSLSDKPCIAVLPLKNMSGDPGQAYFSDGMTADLITELSRFRSLLVIAQDSTENYKDPALDAREVGRALGAGYLVEGGVRRAGDRMRVTVQLTETASGNHVWAERFDRDFEDIFAVQDEITGTIAATIGGRVEAEGRQRAARAQPNSLKAYDYVLRAQAYYNQVSKQAHSEAQPLLQKAIEIDPHNGRAHMLLGAIHDMEYWTGWTADFDGSLALALHHGRKAVLLDDVDSLAHAHLGEALLHRKRYGEAESHFERALALNPNDIAARALYAAFLTATEKAAQSLEQLEIARCLDPFGLYWIPWIRGEALFALHRYDEAVASLQQIDAPINNARALLAACQGKAGQLAEARTTLREFLTVAEQEMAIFPQDAAAWRAFWRRESSYHADPTGDSLLDGLRQAGLVV